MKVSLSPYIILCGWLGLKHQLTNWLCITDKYFKTTFTRRASSPDRILRAISSIMTCVCVCVCVLPSHIPHYHCKCSVCMFVCLIKRSTSKNFMSFCILWLNVKDSLLNISYVLIYVLQTDLAYIFYVVFPFCKCLKKLANRQLSMSMRDHRMQSTFRQSRHSPVHSPYPSRIARVSRGCQRQRKLYNGNRVYLALGQDSPTAGEGTTTTTTTPPYNDCSPGRNIYDGTTVKTASTCVWWLLQR